MEWATHRSILKSVQKDVGKHERFSPGRGWLVGRCHNEVLETVVSAKRYHQKN